MFLRDPSRTVLQPASSAISLPILLATAVVIGFGLFPAPLMHLMKGAAVPMLSSSNLMRSDGQAPAEVGKAQAPAKPNPAFPPGTPAARPAKPGSDDDAKTTITSPPEPTRLPSPKS
jgi:hypothetical protein